MKVIVVVGNKGGVGKTSIALMLAQYLAIVKKLIGGLIDLDPQGNSSCTLIKMQRDPAHQTGYMPTAHPNWDPNHPPENNPNWDGISSIADIFVGRPMRSYPTWVDNLVCFPSFFCIIT